MPGESGTLCGRLAHEKSGWVLQEESLIIRLTFPKDRPPPEGLKSHDLVSLRGIRTDPPGLNVTQTSILVPSSGAASDPALLARLPGIRRRHQALRILRRWFDEAGFIEVETPLAVVCPGMETHLRAFPVGRNRFLRTSPELHLKRLLVAGLDRIVEIGPCFRDEEISPTHTAQFTMIEWYRAYAGLNSLIEDLESLIPQLASEMGLDPAHVPGLGDLRPPWTRRSVRDLILEATGIDLVEFPSVETLGPAVAACGLHIAEEDDWDTLFSRLMVDRVEPSIDRSRPLLIGDYPPSQAALARIGVQGGHRVAERFELFLGGLELANAFHELNDPREQRHRHESERENRVRCGAVAYDLDEAFLGDLEFGMPPSAGIALGFDRLIATLLGWPDIRASHSFPVEGL